MAKHQKTLRLLEEAIEVLSAHHPMTVRQVYYQLVSRQVIKNDRSQYQAVSTLLVAARKDGVIPWDWVEDRLRRPRAVSMWDGLSEFADAVRRSYRRDVWREQPGYVEVWLEKDALSGIFEDVLSDYGVTLNVGRGYDGWDSIHNAALRYGDGEGVTVLYFGDFDPSGEDMVRSLRERLAFFNCHPEIIKCALVLDDVRLYDLPPDFTKATDTRAKAFVARYGDMAGGRIAACGRFRGLLGRGGGRAKRVSAVRAAGADLHVSGGGAEACQGGTQVRGEPKVCAGCQDRDRCRWIGWPFADADGESCPVYAAVASDG